MSDRTVDGRPTVVYLEADDEVTSVVRRLRDADPGPVIIVAPGRSRATSSVVAIRLLARAADADGRRLAVVGDALTRSLAAEAGVAAHATLDAARSGEESRAPALHRASMSVVRGPHDDETAPTLAAAPLPARSAVEARAPATGAHDVTRAVPVVRRMAASRRQPRSPDRWALAVVAVLALLLVGTVAAGMALLPAASVTLVPHTATVGPVAYELELAGARRVTGTVSASTEVVASGAYDVLEAARGTVTFYNFNIGGVDVPAGTLVAAGAQAFETTEPVVVPSGSLTSDGKILAGEADAPVRAAAPGPAGNVPAGAIDTVLNRGTAGRLRGFPQNGARLVANAEPTSGGVDASGPEFVQADLDAAVAALEADLAARVEAAAPDGGIVVMGEPDEPRLEGAEDLVGTRDAERATLTGTLDWWALHADSAVADELARERFLGDASVVPDGHDLLPDSVAVALRASRASGMTLVVEVLVRGAAAPVIDPAEVRRRAAGLTPVEAMAALADVGLAQVELWPGWVAEVPSLEWRIDVRVSGPVPPPLPTGSGVPPSSEPER